MKQTIKALWEYYHNEQAVKEIYAGILGIYGIFYGHKVDAKKRAQFNRAKQYLSTLTR